MHTKTIRRMLHAMRSTQTLRAVGLGAFCVAVSFGFGMNMAGTVNPFEESQASEGEIVPGDMNGDGLVNSRDAVVILEIVRGYRSAQPEELRRDPNGDGRIELDDALRVLRSSL